MSIDLGLCMIVKDEENRIDGCLRDIIDLFQDVVIIDTGSTDKTREILRCRYGIDPVVRPLRPGEFEPHDARNLAFSLISTPWIMTLDADERIDRKPLQALLESKHQLDSTGYFCTWNTYKEGRTIRDYKCVMFRKGIRMVGSPHENPQFDLRRRNLAGSWLDGLTLHHYPEHRKLYRKSIKRIDAMLQSIKKHPEWYRHHWFLGYTLFRLGQIENAKRYLIKAATSCSLLFPVECLNSQMILATIHARENERAKVETTLRKALDFYELVEDDFEISFNTRMKPWFVNALSVCRKSRLREIEAYEFSY